MFLSERERIEILMMVGYGDRKRSTVEVCELFNNVHQERRPISRSTVSKIISKFRETGSVRDKPKSGRPKICDETKLNVLLSYQDNPHSSSRQVGLNQNIGYKSVQNILHKEKYHPYKICLVHELNEDDFDRRLQFCENMQNICNDDGNFARNILFTDEASFCLNGTVNRHNCRYWSTENPHWMQEAHTQHPQKLNVWAGILRNRILGPFFFEDTLNGEGYLDFLEYQLVPALATLYPDYDDQDTPERTIWLQQDGAPPHYARPVRDYLNEVFQHRWIGRRGEIEWPARSPDLTPLDFFLWGYLKERVYKNKPLDLETLKVKIRNEIRQIPEQVIENVQNEFVLRLGYCQVVNGQQFEHLIKYSTFYN